MSDLKSIKLLKDGAYKNMKLIVETPNWGASIEETTRYFYGKVDEFNIHIPLEFYRLLYNDTLITLKELTTNN